MSTYGTHITLQCVFNRLDVAMRLSPTALIGRKLRVYWPDDDGWYLGTAAEYTAQSGQHKVHTPALHMSSTFTHQRPANFTYE